MVLQLSSQRLGIRARLCPNSAKNTLTQTQESNGMGELLKNLGMLQNACQKRGGRPLFIVGEGDYISLIPIRMANAD